MYNIDFDDSKALWEVAKDNCRLADNYLKAREDYAKAVKVLKIALAKAYEENTIKDSISEDKAYLKLSSRSIELKEALERMIENEASYKGIERILDARKMLINFQQSIMKNKPE